jgi:hypothetical protein
VVKLSEDDFLSIFEGVPNLPFPTERKPDQYFNLLAVKDGISSKGEASHAPGRRVSNKRKIIYR